MRATERDGIRVGPAGPEDLDGCVRLAVDLLAHDPGHRLAKLRKDLTECQETGLRALFVARSGGLLAGYSRIEYWTVPPDAAATTAPEGWYLMGLLVDPAHRRTGLGRALTEVRLDWLRARATRAWYFTNARNAASLALHASLGFREVTREFEFPGVRFEGGVGVLCVAELRPELG